MPGRPTGHWRSSVPTGMRLTRMCGGGSPSNGSPPGHPAPGRVGRCELTARHRREMAATFLEKALAVTGDPGAGLVGRVAALRAAHHVRADLPARGALGRAQCELVATLEALGDVAAALQVTTEARAGWPTGENERGERDWIQAAQIRLSHMAVGADPGPLAQQLIAEAAAGGAAPGLEAQIWAAIVLLATPGQRDAALALADQVTAGLEARTDLEAAGDRWRLLLAYHAGRAGLPDLTARLLAPLAASTDPPIQDAAAVVQHAVDGPGADIRLQTSCWKLSSPPCRPPRTMTGCASHHALAANYATLGDYHQALAHGQYELDLRTRIQGRRHPATLASRADIAYWTGHSGDEAAALALYQELLPDLEQVLGPRHHDTLDTRSNIALWTGRCGDAVTALRLYQELLHMEHVLGPRHPDTLTTRGNVADWTGRCGDPAAALRLKQELLPDIEQVFGPRHPKTLTNRNNIAFWTGRCGDPAAALRLYQELLPDRKQVLGPRHPDTLNTRNNIADLTSRCGDAATALRLYRELLPDMEQVLGPRHPETLITRGNIARCTAETGDAAAALRLFRELMPDMEQVLGRRHPTTLTARGNLAVWTGQNGDPAGALRLLRELMPDMEQVLGRRHPTTLTARGNLAVWTGQNGDPAGALRLLRELMPDMEQVLGPRHPETVAVRIHIELLVQKGPAGTGR